MDTSIVGVSGHEQHFGAFAQLAQPLGQIAAAHEGHDHIGQQQVNRPLVLNSDPESFGSMMGCQHAIAGPFENLVDKILDNRVVFYE